MKIEEGLVPTLKQQAPNAGIIGAKVVALNPGSIVPEILVTSSSTSLDTAVIQKAVVDTCKSGSLTLKVGDCSGIAAQSKDL